MFKKFEPYLKNSSFYIQLSLNDAGEIVGVIFPTSKSGTELAPISFKGKPDELDANFDKLFAPALDDTEQAAAFVNHSKEQNQKVMEQAKEKKKDPAAEVASGDKKSKKETSKPTPPVVEEKVETKSEIKVEPKEPTLFGSIEENNTVLEKLPATEPVVIPEVDEVIDVDDEPDPTENYEPNEEELF